MVKAMRLHVPVGPLFIFVIAGFFLSVVPHAYATFTLHSQLDDSGEMVSQQPTFLNTWISAPLGNLFLGKDRLTITFTMKDPNTNGLSSLPQGVGFGSCFGCYNLQKYEFTSADRALLSDGAFHTFTVTTGTTSLGIADGSTPIYVTFFGLTQFQGGTHVKSNAAQTEPYLVITAPFQPLPPPIPQAPPGSVMVYTQSDNTGLMSNPQPTFLNSYIDSASLGNVDLGQGKLYLTFTMKDPNTHGLFWTPIGVCLQPADGTSINCSRRLQTYYFTPEDRALLSDQAFHTFMVETGTTSRAYADGTQPVSLGFFGLSQYQYGTKIKSNADATIPFLKIQKPSPPDPCADGTCASSVLFLPGIEGSRLYRPDYAGGTDQLWEPNTDGDAEDLFLTADGKSVRNDVYTKDVIGQAYRAGPNIYKSFIAQMNELKTSGIIADWKAVPYDWRLSLDDILNYGRQFPDGRIYYAGDLAATSSPYLVQELRRLAKESKTGKVTIVAHSNGGLVAKALIQKLGDTEAAELIDKIIFVAVPQVGAPQAIGALLHGYEQGLPRDWLSIFLTPETARSLARNMSGAYNLLPSASYFTQTDDPAVTFDNSDILAEFRARYGNSIHSGERLHNFITDTRRLASSSPSDLLYPSVGNNTLLSRAETLHTGLDAWVPPQGVSLYEIAGWGEDTLSAIEYKEGRESYCSNPGDIHTCTDIPAIIYSPKEVVEGDGVVLVPSALWTAAGTGVQKYWVNLRKYNNDLPQSLFHLDRKHADILEIPELRTFIQNILTNSTPTPPQFIYTTQPATEAGDNRRLRFLLHSPLNLSVTDNLGNTVNSATSTIPGGRFKRYGEVQVLTVPKDTPLTLNLDGYATGSFTLDMQEIGGGNAVIASSTLSGIPSATSTKATIEFTDGTLQSASPLLLDYNGDGATDFSLEPRVGEEVVFDITPPEAAITFDPVSREMKIIGTDNLSGTTVSITATSSTVTDEAGNTLEIVFGKLEQGGKQIKIKIQELRYNGVSTGKLSKVMLEYEWSVDKTDALKELQEKATVGALKVSGHYDAKKNTTRIGKNTGPGLVIVGIRTENGDVSPDY